MPFSAFPDKSLLIRRIPTDRLDEVLEIVKDKIQGDIVIDQIVIAEGKLRTKDLIWTGILKMKS